MTRKPKPAEPVAQLHVNVPRALHRALKVKAAQTGRPLTAIVADALRREVRQPVAA